MFKLVLEKAEEPEIKVQTSTGLSKKTRMKSKEIYVEASLCFLPASHEKSHEHIFLSMTKQKASGGDENPAELFQILEDDAVKCCTQYARKFGKLSRGHRTRKGQFSFQSQSAMPKNVQTTAQLHSFHMLAK